MLENQEFYVTFGSQYSHEQHPQDMHPNGYVVIEAPNEMVARGIAFANFEGRWSMLYTKEEFFSDGQESVDHWYPMGEVARYKMELH
jgi:hypothetical protein